MQRNNYINYIFTLYRIIVQHLEKFEDHASEVNWHIESKYSEEMASKSKVVC